MIRDRTSTDILWNRFCQSGALLLLILMFSLQSCGTEKDVIIYEYKEICKFVEERKFDSLVNKLDDRSLKFVNFLTDTANLYFQAVKKFGSENDLVFFCTVYHRQFGESVRSLNAGNTVFLAYLGLTGVSLFSWFVKPKLIEEQTRTGDENFVVIGTKVGDNTYVTSKVKFSKNSDGEYMLDLLELLKLRENVLRQSYAHYARMMGWKKRKKTDKISNPSYSNIPDDRLLNFLDNMETTEHQLDFILYDPNVRMN